MSSFAVRLDEALEKGLKEEDRAKLVELIERSAEEWETARPVSSGPAFVFVGWDFAANVGDWIRREINQPRQLPGPLLVSPRQYEWLVQSINRETGTITVTTAPNPATTFETEPPPQRFRPNPSRVPEGLQRKPWDNR